MLSQEQRQAMLETRREHLSRLKPILQQRAELHRLVSTLAATSTSFSNRQEGNVKVILTSIRLCYLLYVVLCMPGGIVFKVRFTTLSPILFGKFK